MKVAIAPAVGHTTRAARLPSGSGSGVIITSSLGGELLAESSSAISLSFVLCGIIQDLNTLQIYHHRTLADPTQYLPSRPPFTVAYLINLFTPNTRPSALSPLFYLYSFNTLCNAKDFVLGGVGSMRQLRSSLGV